MTDPLPPAAAAAAGPVPRLSPEREQEIRNQIPYRRRLDMGVMTLGVDDLEAVFLELDATRADLELARPARDDVQRELDIIRTSNEAMRSDLARTRAEAEALRAIVDGFRCLEWMRPANRPGSATTWKSCFFCLALRTEGHYRSCPFAALAAPAPPQQSITVNVDALPEHQPTIRPEHWPASPSPEDEQHGD